ncbi:MAG: Phenylalanyl-tRNA synthetase beta chain 6 [Betaproteobacteria bacterium]|nr:Phenylalanyl-tRNA synthetase beta chain 6 [Betaproteobacteria bacterium]
MKFPESWLRSFVNPPLSSAELAHTLTMSGLEVEETEAAAPAFTGIVVGEIKSFEKHPNADRLNVCQVDAGQDHLLNIVCGAPNVAAGMKVPCALIGAQLPPAGDDKADGKPFEIKRAKMRGVESEGMLCSARELGMSDDHSGLLPLPADAVPGTNVREVLNLDDTLFTIKLTPNRADALSVLGVARDVAAITSAPFQPLAVPAVQPTMDDKFTAKITDADGCGRFTGRVIKGVNAKAPTPAWMVERLARSGQRSISALVDVTNYVMLELGRPLHVYDLDKLQGGIDVRFGRKGEKLKLLNEQTVELDETVLAITDASGPIGLAGIMGGDSTKAELTTTNVYLESAFFYPLAIQGRARRFNFTSDASHRFERGVDFNNNVDGIERATRLILDICGGQAGPTVDTVAKLPVRKPVTMRIARCVKIIGKQISADEMAATFTRLGFEQTRTADAFTVTAPSYRFDIEIEEDLIEEVARIHGFENIPAAPPLARAEMMQSREDGISLTTLKELAAARDYQEVINFSFVDEKWERELAGNEAPIKLLNPIASQMGVMRSSLFGSLIANVAYNLNRREPRVRVFELGPVFKRDASVQDGPLQVAGYAQPRMLGAVAFGTAYEEQWGAKARPVDYFDVKGDLEAVIAPWEPEFIASAHPALHPGRCAAIRLDGRVIGHIGELHPRWVKEYGLPAAPVLFEIEAAPVLLRAQPCYAEVSKFPPIIRDLALVVPAGLAAAAILKTLQAAAPGVVTGISLFDEYRPTNAAAGLSETEKSLAFRVVMQDTKKTLTDAEADETREILVAAATNKHGARLRA